jgi:hypothetical protein
MEAPCVLYEIQIESLYIILINFSLQTEWREGFGLLPVIRLSDPNILSPVLHNHIDLNAALIRTNSSILGSFKYSSVPKIESSRKKTTLVFK